MACIKSDRVEKAYHVISLIRDLKKGANELIYKTENRVTDVKNKLYGCQGVGEGGGINWGD